MFARLTCLLHWTKFIFYLLSQNGTKQNEGIRSWHASFSSGVNSSWLNNQHLKTFILPEIELRHLAVLRSMQLFQLICRLLKNIFIDQGSLGYWLYPTKNYILQNDVASSKIERTILETDSIPTTASHLKNSEIFPHLK